MQVGPVTNLVAGPSSRHVLGGTMHRTTTMLGAVLLLGVLTACSGSSDGPKPVGPPVKAATVTPTATELTALAPKWTPKLDAAAGANSESTGACQTPSSSTCAQYVTDIMGVVTDLEKDIDVPERGPYPETADQIAKMRDAETTYITDGCEGDPAADDPSSDCSSVVTITVGAATLGMTLGTDDLSQ